MAKWKRVVLLALLLALLAGTLTPVLADMYFPLISNGDAVVVGPLAGHYELLNNEWFQVICAHGHIMVILVAQTAMARCESP